MRSLIFLSLLLVSNLSFADIKISALPLGSAALTNINDSFPYVSSVSSTTKRLTIYDIVNIPSLQSQFLSMVPSQSGQSGKCLGTNGSATSWVTCGSGGSGITALTGDGTASGTGSVAFTLATVNSNVGSFGSATQVPAYTVNAKGLTTAASNVSIQIAESQVTNLVSDLAGKQATGNYITALTGDITASGPGSSASTLATVNTNVGSFTNASITVNAKGLITAASNGSGGGGSGTVTSVGLADSSTVPIYTISGTPVTTTGTLTATLNTQAKNLVFSGPATGSNAQPGFRSLAGADLPNPSASTLGGVQSLAAVTHNFLTSISTSGVPVQAQPACGDLSNAAASCATDATNASNISTGTLALARGGTGLTSGTSGGILGFTATGTLASSGALTANALLLGGGAGVTPSALGSLGTTTTLLHGNVSGAPTFAAVTLTTDVTGTLPVANGGTGQATLTAHDVLVGNGTSGVTQVTPSSAGLVLTSNGTSSDPSFQVAPSAASRTAPTVQKFLSGTGTYGLSYTFFVSSANATAGATYTNNSVTYTVTNTISSGAILVAPGTGAPLSSGTLTKASGTGDATITYSSVVAPLYIHVTLAGGGGGGGPGTSNTSSGGAGGTTTFGTSLLSAGGGAGGVFLGAPTTGGTASLGTGPIGIALSGGSGGGGTNLSATSQEAQGGQGGSNALGGGGGAGSGGSSATSGTSGIANTGAGGGGGGGGPSSGTGSGGAAGGYVNAIITNPAASYAYSLGASGAAGVGTAGGGAGGIGVVIVEEYYQ